MGYLNSSSNSNDDNGAMIPSLIIASVLIALGPFLSFFYTFCVWMTYAINHEISWSSKSTALLLRLSFSVACIAIALGMAPSLASTKTTVAGGDDNDDTRQWWWWPYLLLAILSLGAWTMSIYLMKQTRRDDVVGISKPPYYGGRAMKGKLVLVTGANNGIGKETAQQLASMGATVVMLCRSEGRAKSAMKDILQESKTKNKSENPIENEQLVFVPLDLGEFASIHKAVDLLQKQFPNRTVDVLINNAGLMMGNYTKSKDGYELMMQANHLGHFLLTQLLLQNKMLRTTQDDNNGISCSRVLILTSSTYEMSNKLGGFDFKDMFCDKGLRSYSLFGQYSLTKLANLLHAKELTRRYNCGTSKLFVYAVHPGIVRTNVTSNMNWYWRVPNDILGCFVKTMQKTPAEGAYSSVFAAAAPVEELPVSGCYIVNCHSYPTLPIAESIDDAKKLWQVSDELVGSGKDTKANPEKKSIVG
jgi:NAD(P)-dependent dehydrogenase (short-subunit alcohol dehydrogenase family)